MAGEGAIRDDIAAFVIEGIEPTGRIWRPGAGPLRVRCRDAQALWPGEGHRRLEGPRAIA
ncbi:hypothetical protein TQ38_011580 [Novosphingobium sp. P6W]|jgi:hypothetical protein|nr:hypothetical protein TQ38_011580 [Novosphingobium sp. P6W]KIS29737.1 hypothetical protein TQ38_26930 [Novosphingobium sp. P6W]